MTFDHPYRTAPFDHQRDLVERTWERPHYAILWEQGTGKTKALLDTAAALHLRGRIDGVLVVCPKAVVPVWIDEQAPMHLPEETDPALLAWTGRAPGAFAKAFARVLDHRGLSIVAVNYEALRTARVAPYVTAFLDRRKCLLTVDEAHHIKSPTARRTRALWILGQKAPYRRILTGTPVPNSPFDLYAQFRFLSPDILDHQTIWSFKYRYGRFRRAVLAGGRSFEELIGYRNLDELNRLIAPHSSRVTKDECLDLPPKLYQRRSVEMSPEQQRMYQSLREDLVAEIDGTVCPRCGGSGRSESDDPSRLHGHTDMCYQCGGSGRGRMTAVLAITKIMRLQQIVCGHVTTDSGEVVLLEDVPRIRETIDIVAQCEGRVVVWARFVADIDAITEALRDAEIPAVRYDGRVSDKERLEARRAFGEGEAKVFVANPASAGEGLNDLDVASVAVYYSNSFKLKDRLQSEDRLHREGQRNAVTYVDLISPGTVDDRIVDALRAKRDVAAEITGDNLREWI